MGRYIDALRQQPLIRGLPEQMTHIIASPGEPRRSPAGAAAQHDHETPPIDHMLAHPSDHSMSYVEECQGEGGHHHIVDGNGDGGGSHRLEIMLAKMLEIHEGFVG